MKNLKWITAIAGAIVIMLLLRGFAFTSCFIPSQGMENSLFEGERILVNKWSYGLRLPFMSLLSYQRWNSRPVRKEEIVIFNNPANSSAPATDLKEVFISRCIGVPGDTLLVDSSFTVLPAQGADSPDLKRLYRYPAPKEQQLDSLLSILSICPNELMGRDSANHVRSFSRYEYYLLEQALNSNCWIQPIQAETGRTAHPLIVPGKGKMIRVYPWNRTLLRNTLVLHEGRQAEIRNDTLFVDGRPAQHCYFTKDYYWMASNNSVNTTDSRLFGFVPHDHVIGKASLVWFSKEPGSGLFDGYRWKRFFQPVN